MPLENHESSHPRDQAVKAALRDAAAIVGLLNDVYVATYRGPLRDLYAEMLASWLTDFGGSVEVERGRLVAVVGDRRIAIRWT